MGYSGGMPDFDQVTGNGCNTEESIRRPEAGCRLMLYADAVRGVWLAWKRGEREGRDGSDYVISEITSIAKGNIFIPTADTVLVCGKKGDGRTV